MILPDPKDAIHKAWLYRTLSLIADNTFLFSRLAFKGGTCAAMLGFLDRFSIDLDFDYFGKKYEINETRQKLEEIFKKLDLEIKDKSKIVPQYFLKYSAKTSKRNTLKIDITYPPPKKNNYQTMRFSEIDRVLQCQTIETMFSNKLVALIERYEKHNSIAGRDIYDIHHFFLNGYRYNIDIIKERRKEKTIKEFFKNLIEFVDKRVTNTIINQDLNMLLSKHTFQKLRKVLKNEVIMFLNDELKRCENI